MLMSIRIMSWLEQAFGPVGTHEALTSQVHGAWWARACFSFRGSVLSRRIPLIMIIVQRRKGRISRTSNVKTPHSTYVCKERVLSVSTAVYSFFRQRFVVLEWIEHTQI